jgi:hypothetical protein
MKKCCGDECHTSFCPHCGKKLGTSSGLPGLLRYLRSQQQTIERITEQRRKWAAEQPEADRFYAEQSVKKREAAVAKWKLWADAVEAALKGQE